jgi:hypothetical protein
MKTGDIAAALGKANSAASNLLNTLRNMGRVKQAAHGVWVLSQFANSQIHENSQVNTDEFVNNTAETNFTNSHTPRESEYENLEFDPIHTKNSSTLPQTPRENESVKVPQGPPGPLIDRTAAYQAPNAGDGPVLF